MLLKTRLFTVIALGMSFVSLQLYAASPKAPSTPLPAPIAPSVDASPPAIQPAPEKIPPNPAAASTPSVPIPSISPLPLDTTSSDPDYAIYLKSKYANPKWDSLVKEGFEAFSAGQAIQALDFLQKSVAQGCHSPLAYFKLAATYEFLGNVYTALQYYALVEKDIDALPKDHDYARQFNEHYARALLLNHQEAEAMPYLEKAAPTTDQYWLLSTLANYYLNQNKFDEALPHLLRSVQIPTIKNVAPADIAQVYLAIAKIYITQGKLDETYRYLDYAVQTDPNNREAAAMKNKIIQQKQQQHQMEQMQKMMGSMKGL